MTEDEGAYLREIRRLRSLMRRCVRELQEREAFYTHLGNPTAANLFHGAAIVAADILEVSPVRA